MNRIAENVWEDVPDSTIEEHYLGDECWCEPITHYGPPMACHDGYSRPQVVIEHNYRVRVAQLPRTDIISESTELKGDKNYGRFKSQRNKNEQS